MRNRTSLALIELTLLLFVFALAAAWCLKGFVWADRQSEQQYEYEQAMWQAQSAAEIVKSNGGDLSTAAKIGGGVWEEDCWTLGFDENWEKTEVVPKYTLQVKKEERELGFLGRAVIEVRDNTRVLATLQVGWQEVDEHE